MSANTPKKTTLPFTGERLIPEHNQDQEIFAEHLVRYLFAKPFVGKKVVLDIASGSGYGTKILSESGAKKVIGVDISPDAITYANEHYSADNTEFIIGDATKIPCEDASIDVVISFETIEHIQQYETFLLEIKRVLKPNGILLISTPNKAVYPTGNPYHIKEFYTDEFEVLLKKYFPHVQLRKQKNIHLSSIFSSKDDLKKNLKISSELSDQDPLYLVAICGGEAPINSAESCGLIHDFSDKEILKEILHLQQINDQQASQLKQYKADQKQLAGDVAHYQNLKEKAELAILTQKWGITNFPPYDIIIPVFNGYEFVKECVDSLFQNTNYPNFQVLIVDDGSTCQKTKKYLKKIGKAPRIIYLKNEKNVGFVKSVNRGMTYSQNEVVLLNSDTVLTKNWLLKMHQAQIKNPLSASVTPLTNNGTVCSVPNWCKDNKLPKNLSLADYAKLIEKISLKQYPILPTAVGFCMLITRQSLNIVGLFDEESFGTGYGEENDWCRRAIKAGYTNILDDQTFIEHKGHMTFGTNKKQKTKIEQNRETLNRKHPEYQGAIETFLHQNPMLDVIQNIQLNLEFHNGKKNIAYILHHDTKNTIGGTELHVQDLIDHFQKDYNVFVFIPKGNTVLIRQYANREREYVFELSTPSKSDYTHTEIEAIFQESLQYFSIDLIHFQHLMHWPLSLIRLANESSAKVIFSLHDYFFHCPCPQLLMPNGKFCEFSQSAKKCAHCLPKNKFITTPFTNFNTLKYRRESLSRELKKAEKIITPSRFLSQKAKEVLDLPVEKVERVYHGIQLPQHPCNIIPDKKVLNVAILGVFTPIKGAHLFAELVQRMDKNKNIQFKVIGKNGAPQILNPIKKSIIHREYNRENLEKVLTEEAIGLILLPSIVPESFCYTLSEALAYKIPVVTTDFGAQAERIKYLDGGWCFRPKDFVPQTEALLLDILKNRKILDMQAQKIKSVKVHDKMFEKYKKIYTDIMTDKKPPSDEKVNAKLFLRAARMTPQMLPQKTTWMDKLYWFLVKIKILPQP